MYIIIRKKGFFIQQQITDYFGIPSFKIIDLREKSGQILYAQIFGSKQRIKTNKENKESLKRIQKRLDEFFRPISNPKTRRTPSMFKLPYRKNVRVVGPAEFMEGKLTWAEIEAFKNFQTSNGYLKDLFILNDFQFWNNLELTEKQEKLFGRFFIGDLVKLEIGRCKLGYTNFNTWVQELQSNYNLLLAFNLEYERVPDARNYGRLVSSVGAENVRAFHGLLVKEFERYELIDYQIGVWDGRFFMSNCGEHKQKKIATSSDPESGIYMKGKYKGPGYIESPIMDWKFDLIVYYDVMAANRNDKVVFRQTYQVYLAGGKPKFIYFLTDGGAGASNENQAMVARSGSIPILRWKKSSKPNVIEVKKGLYFNTKHIPVHIIPHMGKIYNLRTGEERMFSPFGVVYKRTRMPNRGRKNALLFTGITAVTQGLTALTAYKVGRIDLIKKSTAFRDIYTFPDPLYSQNYFLKKNRQISLELSE